MNNKNIIDKDNLIGSAIAIDAAEYIIQDIVEDFFDHFDPENKDNYLKIIYEFPRFRAKANILLMLISQIRNEFADNEITAYH